MTAEQRKQQIVAFLKTVLWSVTEREIGQGVGLKKTPYLHRLLEDLKTEGIVLSEYVREPRGYTQYLWLNNQTEGE